VKVTATLGHYQEKILSGSSNIAKNVFGSIYPERRRKN